MSLTSIDHDALYARIRTAVAAEMPVLDGLREDVRHLALHPIIDTPTPTIAAVATDGGQNHVALDPLHVEIVRVVDSDAQERLFEVIPLSRCTGDLWESFQAIEVVESLMERLDLRYDALSRFLPLPGVDARPDHLDAVRDIVEWAVVLDLAWDPDLHYRLILRDGLLRTLKFADEAKFRLRASFEAAHRANGRLLVGVAKRSQLLNYLSLAIALEQPFAVVGPCYTEVPLDMERAAYRRYPEWADRELGRMHLAKLGPHANSPVYPVDIPHWLLDQRDQIFAHLAATAVDSFPIVGYPEPLLRAHEHAVVHGLELSVVADEILDAITAGYTRAESEELIAHITLGRALQSGGWS